ncbi:hypothetical protein GVN20_13345 [Runella sp. CRIBMP]|uniref:hypothetical protein n=1 Tax=Runella sp. CRIBMP TaxID=2683261 RepID=UPI0014130D9B|nr:hypothetical protein [Runella sp. CRIBMP]NBB20344.1 hypothetical protein [Runella sp. CRIBMP]
MKNHLVPFQMYRSVAQKIAIWVSVITSMVSLEDIIASASIYDQAHHGNISDKDLNKLLNEIDF